MEIWTHTVGYLDIAGKCLIMKAGLVKYIFIVVVLFLILIFQVPFQYI
jgi:hypothetical protein